MLELCGTFLTIVKILSLNIDMKLSLLFLVILTPSHLNFPSTLASVPTLILSVSMQRILLRVECLARGRPGRRSSCVINIQLILLVIFGRILADETTSLGCGL